MSSANNNKKENKLVYKKEKGNQNTPTPTPTHKRKKSSHRWLTEGYEDQCNV